MEKYTLMKGNVRNNRYLKIIWGKIQFVFVDRTFSTPRKRKSNSEEQN
jgi:hypothetical protein